MLTLLNSILSTIPTYYLSFLHLLVNVEKMIDSIMKQFLWKVGNPSNSGYPLVSWKRISRNITQDGLGIINIRSFNSALKCKLVWNIISNKENMSWAKLFKSRYLVIGHLGGFLNISSSTISPF